MERQPGSKILSPTVQPHHAPMADQVALLADGVARRAELPAVPHGGRSRAARRHASRERSDVLLAAIRQLTPRVDLGADRLTVMDEKQLREGTLSRPRES